MKKRTNISIFYCSILVMGLTPVFFHVLLLRELISNFFGNEVIIAIFLAFWLLIEAFGSGVLSRPLVKRANPVSLYSLLLVLNAILGPLSLFLSRTIRNVLFLDFGEVPSLIFISLGIIIVIFPLAAVDGCMFRAGYKMGYAFENKKSKVVGRVYAVESLGAVLGGVFVTALILCNLSPFSMVAILSLINIIIAMCLKFKTLSHLPYLIGLTAVIIFLLNISWLEKRSSALRWKEYDLLAFKNSPYHNIVLTEKENQKCLFVDGRASISLPQGDIVSIEEFAHIPFLYNEDAKRILIVGEGPGGLINEFLKYPNLAIDYLQPDKEIIKTLLDTHCPLVERELSNPRVNVINRDPISYIKRGPMDYDAVFIAVGSPSTFLSGRYFTRELFAYLKKALSQNGLLAIKMTGGVSYINDELKLLLSTIHTTLKKSFHRTHFIPGENLIFLASDHIDLSAIPPSKLISKLKGKGLQTKYLSPYSLQVKYHPARVSFFQRIFEDSRGEINSVNRPIVVYQALSYESTIHAPFWGKSLSYLREIPRGLYFVVLLFPLFLLLVFSKVSKGVGRVIIPLTIGLTGMAGMVGSMAITIFFQELFGSLYLKMGLIFSSFMLGLFISALAISRGLPDRYSTQGFIFSVESLIFLFFLGLIPVFWLFPGLRTNGISLMGLETSLYLLNFLLGCLVGMEFPVANWLMEEEKKEAGGMLYAFDLLGAFIGSIIFVTLVLPLMGFVLLMLLVASLKFANILLILTKIR